MYKGNKAVNLARLQEAGFNVPPFFVCDATCPKDEILMKINNMFSNTKYFAIRSSAENEDSRDKSFAGHFYSAVGISRENIYTEITNVCDSFEGTAGSVIVQEFIPSDTAGVMFTDVGNQKIIINAIQGLCRPVVDGHPCDEYICDRDALLLDKTIALEKETELFEKGKFVSSKNNQESLTQKNFKPLVQIAIEVEKFFGSPQDIEWCLRAGELYILQSRHITRKLNLVDKDYFDSANIAESYSGIVLPLTCSLAQMVYEQVYKDLLRMSGVSSKNISKHSDIFKNLLGFFYGRMYYNMNNWYQMAAFVPGYDRNKENFELMITSNIKQSVSTSIKPSLIFKIIYPLIVTIKTLVFGLTTSRFMQVAKREIHYFRNYDLKPLSYQECINMFEDVRRRLLRRWYVTVENDFFVMTYLGILKKLFGEERLQKMILFESKATKQVGALATLSKMMQSNSSLWSAIMTDNTQDFYDALSKDNKTALLLENYLSEFGGRFASELKLESIGFDEDTIKLFTVLRAYINYVAPEQVLSADLQLPFWKKVVASFFLGKFKKYASRREEFRLLRSNTFAIIRRLIRHMGMLLVKEKILENVDDIFYLELKEVFNSDAIKNKKLLQIVKQRKQDYDSYKKITPPAHFAISKNTLPLIQSAESSNLVLSGRPASPGTIRGRVRVFREFIMPTEIDFDILVTSHTDPGWTSLIALSKGLIIEHGGVLSHASIVARELGIPTVIGATNAVNLLKDGQIVEINGATGSILVI